MKVRIHELPKATKLPSPENIILPIFKSHLEPYPTERISIRDLVAMITDETLTHGEIKLFIDFETGIMSFSRSDK